MGAGLALLLTATGDLQPDGWWESIVAEDAEVCRHTASFAHSFMPHVHCESKEKVPHSCPGNDGHKWLCGVDEIATRQRLGQPCVAYSFGSHANTCFENAVAKRTGCEIHIFDPTSKTMDSPSWSYHRWGLAGDNNNDTTYWRFFGRRAGNRKAIDTPLAARALTFIIYPHIPPLAGCLQGLQDADACRDHGRAEPHVHRHTQGLIKALRPASSWAPR